MIAKVKLRAFEIHNPDINKKESDLCTKLRKYLYASKEVNERRMLLNSEDPQKEEDFISDFVESRQDTSPQFCTMVRVALGNNVQHINSKLFSKPSFTITELNNDEVDAEAIYKKHYYFSTSNNFLVTNLPGNLTITRLQTYLNWLLEDLYEINPLLMENVVEDLSNIKAIIVNDSKIYPSKDEIGISSETRKSSFELLGETALNFIKSALTDTKGLSDIELKQMISAKLVIEFKKAKKSDSESIKKAYSALLKPVADLDNFSFVRKDNKTITKGGKILLVKPVNIETTESGLLNESHLSQEMSRLILDLENEKTRN